MLAIQHDLPAEVLAALPDVTVVKFENTRYAMALLSTAYFGRPALEMTMVGVTGTKGKTTTTHMIKAVLVTRSAWSAPTACITPATTMT